MPKLMSLLLVVLITACGNSPKPVSKEIVTEDKTLSGPGPSVLLTFQPTNTNGNIHYSAYFPVGYATGVSFPVLILFDPHGAPDVPLNKYKELADRYNFILIGSHESKNGNGARETSDIISALASQARALPKADTSLIYCGGFSGGGRVAGMMGLSPLRLQGIVTSGAGLPGGSWFGAPPNVVVSIGGTSDMNLHEVKSFNTQKKELMSRYFRLYFDGGHAWPPVAEMEFAFITFRRMAIKDKLAEKDEDFIKKSQNWLEEYCSGISDPLLKSEVLYNIIRISEGITAISGFEKEYATLKASQEYQAAKKYDQQLDQEEEKTKVKLYNEIFMKDTSWWRATSTQLLDTSGFIRDRNKIAMIHRIQGHLSLGIYSTLIRTIAAMRVDQGVYLATLYRMIDPMNTEAWYLSAEVAMQMGLSSEAVKYLEKAVSIGFNDVERCRKDPYFASLQSENSFQSILSKMH